MPKRLTKEQFIEKSKKIHGDKYDYSKVEYINTTTPIKIICPIHGEFEQTPYNHLDGCGCRECGKIKRISSKTKTLEKFIEDARKVHDDKYDYSKVNYIKNKVPVTIICPKHGEFSQTPHDHLDGHGCRECTNAHKLSTQEFIEKARKVHGDKYDYSKVKYDGAFSEVTIVCPIHGEFPQKATLHLQGCGCKDCSNDKHRKSTEQFIEEAKAVHGNRYDYSKTEYKTCDKDVIITCPIHGEFPQSPYAHVKLHQGCPECAQSHLENEVSDKLNYHNIKYHYESGRDILNFLGRKSIDFYLPNHNLAIECQGIQHFKSVKYFGGESRFISCLNRDKLKKQLCEEHGIEVIYFTHEKVEGDYLGKVFTDVDEMIKYIESKKQ